MIIGNPPYVEYSKVRKNYAIGKYQTELCGNLYAYIMERSLQLRISHGRIGMIVPVSLLCTERTIPLQKLLLDHNQSWNCSFDMRPSSLFTGVSQRLTISLCAHVSTPSTIYLGGYSRWENDEREKLLQLISYVSIPIQNIALGSIPKISSAIEASIVTKLQGQKISSFEVSPYEHPVYVHRIVRYFVKAIDFVPYFWNEVEGQKKSEDYKPFFFREDILYPITAILNSSLFYLFWHTHSDGFHCGYRDIRLFKVGSLQTSKELTALQDLGKALMVALQTSTIRKSVTSKSTGRMEYDEFNPRACLDLIREIDGILMHYFGFTDEELDFIINYDIKYRMGRNNEEEDEG